MPFRRLAWCLAFLFACSNETPDPDGGGPADAASEAATDASTEADGSDGATDDATTEAGTDAGLAPVGLYRGTCDGSGAVWLDATRFLNFDDESQTWRIFAAGEDAPALQSGDFGAALGVSDESDVEDAVRIGDRIFAITSHGRNKDGELEEERYRFFALDLAGVIPSATLTLAGSTDSLLEAMLDADNYAVDDEDARMLLIQRSNLADPEDANLAPKVNGTSIEGLAVLPDGTTLAIGFRNPQLTGSALVVTLTNPNEVLTGATPAFGRIIRMNLGGLGIRGMRFDDDRDFIWIIAGPHTSAASPFKLYRWSGVHTDAPVEVATITPPANRGGPEVILPVAGEPYLRLLYDQGAMTYSGTECKDLLGSIQRFSDVIVPVPGP